MRLRIDNFAKVKSADLELKGITVIAGENNTGKSTVGKILFAMFNSMSELEDKIYEQKRDLVENILEREINNLYLEQNGDKLYISIPASFYFQDALDVFLEGDEEKKEQVLIAWMENRGLVIEPTDVDNILEEVNSVNRINEDLLIEAAVTDYFQSIFGSDINSKIDKESTACVQAMIKDKTLAFRFDNNQCSSVERQFNVLNSATYIDNPFVIDKINTYLTGETVTECDIIDKLRRNVEGGIVSKVYVEAQLKEAMAHLQEVSDGHITETKAGRYIFSDEVLGEDISINNLSTGLKAFVLIQTLLEKGSIQKKDVLILDEPEIHLHPQWQLSFAEIIVLLEKIFDLTIVVTTHSAHFLEAIQVYSQKYNLTDKCTYYLSKTDGNGCTFEDVTDEPEKILGQLVEPNILLDRIRLQLEEDADGADE